MSTLDKGVTYTGPDDSELRRLMGGSRRWRSMSRSEQDDWVLAHNERSKIVAHDRDSGKPLVAEEVDAHVLGRVPANIRHLARMIYDLPAGDRVDLLALFSEEWRIQPSQFVEWV